MRLNTLRGDLSRSVFAGFLFTYLIDITKLIYEIHGELKHGGMCHPYRSKAAEINSFSSEENSPQRSVAAKTGHGPRRQRR